MITLSQVRDAKSSLKDKLKPVPKWLKGIGISNNNDGNYCLQVNVSEINNEVLLLPKEINGVSLKITVVGIINARDTDKNYD